MNSDEISKKILGLPTNWWQNETTSSVLIKQFKKHILPLLVAGEVNNQIQYNVYSGIFLKHNDSFMWVTAGHVVEEIQLFLSSTNFKLISISWLDGFNSVNANAVPLHKIEIPMKSWKESNLDIGVVVPSLLDIGNLLKNENVLPVDAKIWKNLSNAKPEGYYALGFPRPWCQHIQTPIQDQKTLNKVTAEIACLPLEKIQPPPIFSSDSKWSNPDAFYGRILPYTDDPDFDLEDANGMSGGPILSVERNPNGSILYRLVGVIQSYLKSQSIFRAEPIDKTARAIDMWLSDQVTSCPHPVST